MSTTVRHICPCGAERQHQCPLHWPPADSGFVAHPTEERWRVELLDGDQWMPAGRLHASRDGAVDALNARRSVAKTWTADGTPVRFRLVRETTTYTVDEPQP